MRDVNLSLAQFRNSIYVGAVLSEEIYVGCADARIVNAQVHDSLKLFVVLLSLGKLSKFVSKCA